MRSRRVINRGRMERVAGERCADGDDSTAGDRTAGGGALVELHVTGPVRSAVPGADTAVGLRGAGGGPGPPVHPRPGPDVARGPHPLPAGPEHSGGRRANPTRRLWRAVGSML